MLSSDVLVSVVCAGSAVKTLGDSDVFITILCVGSAVKTLGNSDVFTKTLCWQCCEGTW